MERLTPEALTPMAGVSRLPRLIDGHALVKAVRRHYPPDLRAAAVHGSVLVDARIDENGSVTAVEPVPRPPADIRYRAVVVSRDPATGAEIQRSLAEPGEPSPAFEAAARAALREVRFTPAEKDGRPVPFTLQMTVRFD
jgi:outer membrane biosynthesis protein TonB